MAINFASKVIVGNNRGLDRVHEERINCRSRWKAFVLGRPTNTDTRTHTYWWITFRDEKIAQWGRRGGISNKHCHSWTNIACCKGGELWCCCAYVCVCLSIYVCVVCMCTPCGRIAWTVTRTHAHTARIDKSTRLWQFDKRGVTSEGTSGRSGLTVGKWH